MPARTRALQDVRHTRIGEITDLDRHRNLHTSLWLLLSGGKVVRHRLVRLAEKSLCDLSSPKLRRDDWLSTSDNCRRSESLRSSAGPSKRVSGTVSDLAVDPWTGSLISTKCQRSLTSDFSRDRDSSAIHGDRRNEENRTRQRRVTRPRTCGPDSFANPLDS